MARKTILFAAVASGLMLLPASAGVAQEGTVGDCISDGFYGNEPNLIDPFAPGGPEEQEPGTVAGRVVPSQSPGPFVNNPNDPDNPFEGSSVGDIHRALGGGTVPEFCRTTSGF